jgi:ketosteroid isomerase-like protein
MSEHPNAALVRQAIDAMNRGDLQVLIDMIADDIVWHEIGNPVPILGKPALRKRFSSGPTDIGIAAQMHDVLANDDHTIALLTATASRDGRVLTYRTTETFHIRDGLITERWAFSDDTAEIADFFR